MKLCFFLLLTIWAGNKTFAQNDTIVCYDVKTQVITLIAPVDYDTSLQADHTGWNPGLAGTVTYLSVSPPTVNLFAGSDFCDLEKASLSHPVTDYPVRTAVHLFYYYGDSLGGTCSGMLVSGNFVLTAGHCIRSVVTGEWHGDSILVAPVFDNATYAPGLPTSMVEKYYLFKVFYDGSFVKDFALLQLRQPIGIQTGWVGMAFNKDDVFFENRVFHKFSYPGQVHPSDPTQVYNGDTLYYNYGYITANSSTSLIVPSAAAEAVPGQSGSSLLFTDNDTAYFTFGTLSFSSQYQHFRITPAVFYQLREILEQNPVGISENIPPSAGISIYPNPFDETALVRFDHHSGKSCEYFLYNARGETVQQLSDIRSNAFTIARGSLPSGIYFYSITDHQDLQLRGKLVVR